MRYCAKCESDRLGMVERATGYWRKECLACGSTGPFVLAPVLAAVSFLEESKP